MRLYERMAEPCRLLRRSEAADGEGGVQADADGSTYLVVDVDTTAKTVTFVL